MVWYCEKEFTSHFSFHRRWLERQLRWPHLCNWICSLLRCQPRLCGRVLNSRQSLVPRLKSTAVLLCVNRLSIERANIQVTKVPVLLCDNIRATYLSSNPVFQTKMKHLVLDYHIVRQQVQNKRLQVSYISSKDQYANGFTRPFGLATFWSFSNQELCQ